MINPFHCENVWVVSSRYEYRRFLYLNAVIIPTHCPISSFRYDVTKIQYTTNISSLKSITYCVKYLSRLPLKNHIPGCLTAVIKMYGTTSTVHSISLDEP